MHSSRMILGVLGLALVLTLGFGPGLALAQTPPGCVESVGNGGFETRDFWQLGASPAPPQYTTLNVHSGAWSLSLGISDGINRESFSSARQTVVIPPDAQSVQLSFWVYTIATGAPDTDTMEMVLLSEDGSTILAKPWYAHSDNRAWSQLIFNLSAWRGRTMQLYFNVRNDGVGGMAQMYLDDVSLALCSSGGAGGGTGGGSCGTDGSGCGLITPALPTGVPITPTRGACPNLVLPCQAPRATPKAATAPQSQAAPAIIEPQAAQQAPAIIEPQAMQDAPAIIEPQAAQDAPAIIAGEPQLEMLQPSILDLSATEAQFVPLPTGTVELQGQAAAAIAIPDDSVVEPQVTRLALVITALPPAPLPVEPGVPIEIGNATPVPKGVVTPTPGRGGSSIMDKWPKYWWLIPILFFVVIGLLWLFARRSNK